jgi:hypothetical protein
MAAFSPAGQFEVHVVALLREWCRRFFCFSIGGTAKAELNVFERPWPGHRSPLPLIQAAEDQQDPASKSTCTRSFDFLVFPNIFDFFRYFSSFWLRCECALH